MSFRPVAKHETREDGIDLKNWDYFCRGKLSEKDRRREKRRLIEKNRAHLDICPYELLKVVDPNLLSNDENVICYLPALLRLCERINLETLLCTSRKDSALADLFKTMRYVEKEESETKEGGIGHSFWMGEAPITERQWNVVMSLGGVQEQGGDRRLSDRLAEEDRLVFYATVI